MAGRSIYSPSGPPHLISIPITIPPYHQFTQIQQTLNKHSDLGATLKRNTATVTYQLSTQPHFQPQLSPGNLQQTLIPPPKPPPPCSSTSTPAQGGLRSPRDEVNPALLILARLSLKPLLKPQQKNRVLHRQHRAPRLPRQGDRRAQLLTARRVRLHQHRLTTKPPATSTKPSPNHPPGDRPGRWLIKLVDGRVEMIPLRRDVPQQTPATLYPMYVFPLSASSVPSICFPVYLPPRTSAPAPSRAEFPPTELPQTHGVPGLSLTFMSC